MHKQLFFTALMLSSICTTITVSAAPVDIFGYGEFDQLLQTGDETAMMTGTKLRVDLLSTSADGFTFGSNLNFHLYHGHTTWNLLDFLPASLTAAIPEDSYDLYAETYDSAWELDNIWLKMRFGVCDLTLGKQQMAFGSGYAWNPTDLFNNSDLLDVTYEKPGHQVVRLDVAAGQAGSLLLAYEPAAELVDATTVIQWQRNVSRFEVTLLAARSPWIYTDYSSGLLDHSIPDRHEEQRFLYGGSLVGELLGMGIWSEYAWNDLAGTNNFGDFSELVIGTDHTFRNGFYLLGEYFWNGEGRDSSEDYTLTDWLRMYTAETRSLACSQLYLYCSYPATDLLSIGLTALYSISDGGAALVPTLYYTPETETEITFMGHIYAGDKQDQFNEELGIGALLRIRRYF